MLHSEWPGQKALLSILVQIFSKLFSLFCTFWFSTAISLQTVGTVEDCTQLKISKTYIAAAQAHIPAMSAITAKMQLSVSMTPSKKDVIPCISDCVFVHKNMDIAANTAQFWEIFRTNAMNIKWKSEKVRQSKIYRLMQYICKAAKDCQNDMNG